MKHVVSLRTRFHTFVLDEVHKSHNISAILRTIEGFGYQDVHLIHHRTRFVKHRSVSKKAEQWLTLHRYSSVSECIASVKQKGYRIGVTHAEGMPLDSLDWSVPTAVVVGAELDGVDAQFVREADIKLRVPMMGFVQSFNVSVAVGCMAYGIRAHMEQRVPKERWQLHSQEHTRVLTQWARLTREKK